ncbi:TonB-dependent receptor domain-containing protein [Brevundimonas subvibrioides]|uniref:TonB-dependent receptor domain-containing protein n=1 Tax=Brevundimonas subvibrioides TaxID=74313 RepID=UPI0022B54D4B|nr:TonB-dependent receptor [Brevundimonas subvibrioides]
MANSPIVTVTAEDFQATGSVNIETLINDLPQFTPSANMTSNNPSNGGQANVQLRGLGTGRTLVLLNGRRIVASNASSVVDLNILPTSLISSIETITGGASSTYGSDAVAGVLNFLLDDDFEGVRVDVQYGETDRNDGDTNAVNLTIGGDIADGRGHAMLSFDYSHRSPIFNAARPFSAVSGFSGASPLGSTIFDGTNLPTTAVVSGFITGAVNSNTFGFNNNGTLFTYQGARDYVSPGSIDYEGFRTPGPLQQADFAYNTGPLNYGVLPQNRYNVFASANYEINPAAEVYTEFLFSQYTTANVLAPSPAAGTATGFRVPTTNPFISAELRAVLNSRPIPNASFRLDKRFNALGPRQGSEAVSVYQITTGIRGQLEGTRDWSYDAYLSYGRVDDVTTQSGNVSRSAVQRLLDAADGGASLCAGGFNPFGESALSAACAAYIGRQSKNTTVNDQRVFELNLQGGLFDLPAGEVRVALGGTYREQNYDFLADAALSATALLPSFNGTTTVLTTQNDIAGFNAVNSLSGSDKVFEGYGEILIPLLANLPLIQSLETNLGYRVSSYDSVGMVESYKADANWVVFDGLTVRGGVQRAVRAPSIGELFSPQNLGFPSIGSPTSAGAPAFSADPCDIRTAYRSTSGSNLAASTNAQVRALCLTQGVPTAVIDTYTYPNQQVSGLSGGNPTLFEETADSFTVGIVASSPFENAWLSGFTASVDYYNIEIADVVGTVSVTEQLRRCFNYDGASNPTYDPNNVYCQLFRRDPASGQVANTFETNANLGALVTSGIDFQVDWVATLADLGLPDWGRVAVNVTGTKLEEWKRQDLPGGTFTERTGTLSNSFGLTLPEWKSLTSVNWTKGPFGVGVRWRYQGSALNFNNRTQVIDAVNYFDLNGSWAVNDTIALRAGVNNLTDELAPVYAPAVAANTDPSAYDVLGRRYYIGLSARF